MDCIVVAAAAAAAIMCYAFHVQQVEIITSPGNCSENAKKILKESL